MRDIIFMNQNKDEIVGCNIYNLPFIEIICYENNLCSDSKYIYDICVNKENPVLLGRYESEERCKEVLSDI